MSGDPLCCDLQCSHLKLLLYSLPNAPWCHGNKCEEDQQDDKAQGQHYNPGDLVGGVQYQNSCTCNDQADTRDWKAPVLPTGKGLPVKDWNYLVLSQPVLGRLDMDRWRATYRGSDIERLSVQE